ncbi:MAG: hypothetical protein SNH28_04155 [Rikenellaceae bacterium]
MKVVQINAVYGYSTAELVADECGYIIESNIKQQIDLYRDLLTLTR